MANSKEMVFMDIVASMIGKDDKKMMYGQGQVMNLAPDVRLNSRVAEINGMSAPTNFGLRDRLMANRKRQFGLLRNKRLKGLLA